MSADPFGRFFGRRVDFRRVQYVQQRPQRLWLHVLLFILTFLSAMLVDADYPADVRGFGALFAPFAEPWRLLPGLPFGLSLMAILLAHEMGHYLTARRLGVEQSLPFFIPAPGTIFGTLGAVIVMRSRPSSRDVLLRIAAAGPYAGMVLAIPCAAWGLYFSEPIPAAVVPDGALWFGSSLLFGLLEWLFSPNGSDVFLHPLGRAGWVGMLITSLNLIPAGQLDGGHISYALFGRFHYLISWLVVALLVIAGLLVGSNGGEVWFVWAGMLAVFGLRHPPVFAVVAFPAFEWCVCSAVICPDFYSGTYSGAFCRCSS